jgi:hypothetical protein
VLDFCVMRENIGNADRKRLSLSGSVCKLLKKTNKKEFDCLHPVPELTEDGLGDRNAKE